MGRPSKKELYLPRVTPRWDRASDLVAALGCKVVRHHSYEPRRHWIGESAQCPQLLTGGLIYFSDEYSTRITSDDWAHIAHEAVHHHAGMWSVDDERPMLPFELELVRRIAKDSERHACFDYLVASSLDIEAISLQHANDRFGLRPHWSAGARVKVKGEWEGELYREVFNLVEMEKSEWTVSPRWNALKEQGERRRLPLDGRLRHEALIA